MLLKKGIAENTSISYDRCMSLWFTFISSEGLTMDYISSLNSEDRLTVLLLYVVYLHEKNLVVDPYFSALRSYFIECRYFEMDNQLFTNDILRRAKTGAKISRRDLVNNGRVLPSVKPISQSELDRLSSDFWHVSSNFRGEKNQLFKIWQERIKYLGIMVGINYGLRASEFCFSSTGSTKLILLNSDVIFINTMKNLRVMSHLVHNYINEMFDKIQFTWLDSKVGLQRIEFLTDIYQVEKTLIHQLLLFCCEVKMQRQGIDYFFEIFLDNQYRLLSRYMVSNTIKAICKKNNLGTIGFSSKSCRVSANTFVNLENDLFFRSRESLAGMFSTNSKSHKFYTRKLDVNSGGLCLIKEYASLMNSDTIRRNFMNN